jgi:hypothetical protein
MKGKIDRDGDLYIERAGKLKPQHCPPWNIVPCGDWCPLFREVNLESKPGKESIVIDLCRRQLVFDEFADERSQP